MQEPSSLGHGERGECSLLDGLVSLGSADDGLVLGAGEIPCVAQ